MKNKNRKETEFILFSDDKITLNLGYDLLPLVDKEKGELINEIAYVRRCIFQKTKINIPTIRVMDDTRLYPREFVFRINEGVYAISVKKIIPENLSGIDAINFMKKTVKKALEDKITNTTTLIDSIPVECE